jgi:two-component system sensor histidine kinase/response regulator
MKTNFKKYWEHLIGNSAAFALEARTFHSVCVVTLLGLALNTLYNYMMAMPALAILMLSVLVAVTILYYLSRFKNRYNYCFVIFEILNTVLLVVNYYYNSGSYGPTYAIFILSFLITVAIVPVRQYWIWLPLNIGACLGLMYYESANPEWIISGYTDSSVRLIDFGYTYVVIAAMIVLVTSYIRNAFNREKEESLYRADALVKSNQTKDRLLSVLAHDIKEPLASIQGFLELLSDYRLEEAERLSIEKQLLSRTKDTTYLLANVLAWTKGQMEAVKVKLSNLRLQEALGNTLKLVKGIAEEKGIEFTYQLNDQVCISGDKDMLQLVIRNLVINAIKFTYPGGKITFDVKIKGDACMLSVTDSGAGIPLLKQPGLFSLSARSTFGTGKEKGAGLGLVLCKEFTEMQGGQIGFISKENEGSTFYLIMPLCGSFEKRNVVLSIN